MLKYTLLVTLEANPGKEKEAEEFLKYAMPLVNEEPETTKLKSFKIGSNKFWIFNTFPGEERGSTYLEGKVAKALMEKAPDLFAGNPQIEQGDELAVKG